jgi:23S rRNA (uracil1939-C5)-methyltransferase
LKSAIETLSHDGRGIARVDGKTVFVVGALPGEMVEFSTYKRHKRYDEAMCDKVIVSVEERATPACPHFYGISSKSICGGCSLQHLNVQSQREHKQGVLLEQLKHFGHVAPEKIAEPLIDSSSWGYRRRARLSVRWSDKRNLLYVGFRERIYPRQIAEMNSCEILLPAIGKKIRDTRTLIESLDAKQYITQIEVAAGEDAVVLIFRHQIDLSESDKEKLLDFGLRNNFWILLQAGSIDNLEWLLPAEPQPLFYKLHEEDLTFFFHPAHFTQVNPGLNQKLVKKSLQLLNPQLHETILDLFCGLGNFSLPLAKRAKQVVGVEVSEMMVNQAQLNAKANHLTNASFFAADLSNISFREMPWAQTHYDKILLDPARMGALEIVHSIEQWNPSTIVYVSCNPATLARDANILVNQKGYVLREAGIADMFPHTSHVESIALFEKPTC